MKAAKLQREQQIKGADDLLDRAPDPNADAEDQKPILPCLQLMIFVTPELS